MVRPYNTGSTLRTGGSKGIYQIQILQLAVNASTCGPAALADVSRCTDRYSFLGCDAPGVGDHVLDKLLYVSSPLLQHSKNNVHFKNKINYVCYIITIDSLEHNNNGMYNSARIIPKLL